MRKTFKPIYETEFLDCSYGFRPGRSQHQALEALRDCLKLVNGGWVLDMDIRKFFDSIPHPLLKDVLHKRVNDSVILRLIAKWLKVGVMEDGYVQKNKLGTPQGGVISPLLSNIYLHEVIDSWFALEVQPRMYGKAYLIRFADDCIMVFEDRRDAERVLKVLPQRMEKYGLSLHPEKTRLIDFRHPWDSGKKPETFDFLGFTHYWGKTRRGGYSIKKKTRSKKLRASLKDIHHWCKTHRHEPVAWQHKKLSQKIQGHYAYYGVTGNYRSIQIFQQKVMGIWHHWLNRRSNKQTDMKWERFRILLRDIFILPKPRIIHRANQLKQGLLYV